MRTSFFILFIFLIYTSCSTSNHPKVYDSFAEFESLLETSTNEIHVVNFWATWCTQCRKEIPEMVKLSEKYKKNKKIKILYVNLDESDRQHLVVPYLRKYNIKGEVVSLIDPDQGVWIDQIEKSWNGSLPGTLFFKGKHRKFYGMPLTFDELERNIKYMEKK